MHALPIRIGRPARSARLRKRGGAVSVPAVPMRAARIALWVVRMASAVVKMRGWLPVIVQNAPRQASAAATTS